MSEEKLNLPERMLAMELAQLLAIRLDAELDRVDGELYNIGQSNYECACHALNLVGVYQQAQHYTRHKVVVPVERIHEHMTELNAISREAFDTLLSAFIENFINYGGGLTGYRSVFPVPERLTKALKLLVSCGYAEQSDRGFRWTEKIAPIMRRWRIWNADGVCKQEQIDLQEGAIVAELERTMPAYVRRKLLVAMRSGDPRKPYRVLQTHLEDGQWQQFPLFRKRNPKKELSKELSFRTVNELLRRVRESS